MNARKNNAELLDETLDNLFKHLEEVAGLQKIPDETKKNIKDDMKKQLEDTGEKDQGELVLEDLKHINVQKKLLGCMMAKILGDDKQYKSLLDNLRLEVKRDKPDKDLEKKLEHDCRVLIALKSLEPKKDGKDMELLAAARKLLQNKRMGTPQPGDKKPDQKGEKELENELAKQLDYCLRNLYGGTNPTVSGGVNFPIVGPILGNLGAYPNQTTADQSSVALMVEANTLKSGKADPLGLENAIRINALSEGISPESTIIPTPKRG